MLPSTVITGRVQVSVLAQVFPSNRAQPTYTPIAPGPLVVRDAIFPQRN